MQSGIEEYIEKNKNRFNIVYDELTKLRNKIEIDFTTIDKIIKELPDDHLNDEEEWQLRDIIRTLEIHEKMYEMDLRNYEMHINKYEDDTRKFINTLPSTKGPVQIAKGSLIQLSTDHMAVMREEFEQTKKLVFDLMRKIKELIEMIGGNSSNVNYKKIREFIEQYVKELLNPVTTDVKKYSETHGGVIKEHKNVISGLRESCENMLQDVANHKMEVTDAINSIVSQFNQLGEGFREMEKENQSNANKLKELANTLYEELSGLKTKITSKFNGLDEYINNNSIKRYYI